MKLKKVFAAVVLSAFSVAPAFAGVAGLADLSISQLLVVDPITHLPSSFASQIQISSDTRTGTAASNFNGVVGTGIGDGSITDTRIDGSTASVDVKYRCAGPSCGSINAIYGGSAENNTTTHFAANAGNFALGDMNNQGNALAGGASGLTRADSSVDTTNKGGANATIHNGVSVVTNFTTVNSVDLQLALTYSAFVRAFVDPLLPAGNGGLASGGIGWSLTLRNSDTGAIVLLWSPDELNHGLLSRNGAQNAVYSSNGTIFSEMRTLAANTNYSLVIEQNSNSTVLQVPEPGSLALLGLGMLGLAATTRRRKVR